MPVVPTPFDAFQVIQLGQIFRPSPPEVTAKVERKNPIPKLRAHRNVLTQHVKAVFVAVSQEMNIQSSPVCLMDRLKNILTPSGVGSLGMHVKNLLSGVLDTVILNSFQGGKLP